MGDLHIVYFKPEDCGFCTEKKENLFFINYEFYLSCSIFNILY
jgi:hypothetical protein